MKILLLVLPTIFLFHNNVKGQATSQVSEKVFVFVDKQTGETFSQDMEYQLLHWYQGVGRYPYKISGDTTFIYLDKDPIGARMAIDSISKAKLNKSVIVGEIVDYTGTQYLEEDLKGKVIVLNFWATWCAPCIKEFPALNKLTETFDDKDVLFFAPTTEASNRLDGFFAQRDFDYKVVPNASNLAEKLNVFGVPTHVIIDKNNIVRFMQIGGDNETIHDVLASEINKYL